MTTRQYKLTPFIRLGKFFLGLIFVVEGDRRKFSFTKISRSMVWLDIGETALYIQNGFTATQLDSNTAR